MGEMKALRSVSLVLMRRCHHRREARLHRFGLSIKRETASLACDLVQRRDVAEGANCVSGAKPLTGETIPSHTRERSNLCPEHLFNSLSILPPRDNRTMNARFVYSLLVAFGIALFISTSARAAAPQLDGAISGIELAPQSLVGAAVFVFEYHGVVNGQSHKGWGWMAVTHEDLPKDLFESSLITGGFGEIYVGLRRFDVEVYSGLLTLVDDHNTARFDDDFAVEVSVDIGNFFSQTAAHGFEGLLSHVPFPPTIVGELTPE
jgi:hypothetical protein